MEQQPGPYGIENRLRRLFDPFDFKVVVHYQEDVEVSRRRFRSDETAPYEDSAQSSACAGKFQERSQAACQPNASRGRTAEPVLEFPPIRRMHTGRQCSFIGKLG